MTKRYNANALRQPPNRMQGKASWWVLLAVVLLAIYFIVFRPREASDGLPVASPELDAQQQQPAREPTESLPNPEGEGLGAADAAEDAQLRRDREFIARAFPILSRWDMAAVKPLLSAATIAASSDAQLAEVMGVLEQRLGALQSFEQPVPTTTADSQQSADRLGSLKHYEFTASYASGPADVDLVLHQLPESSSLYSFNINVPD